MTQPRVLQGSWEELATFAEAYPHRKNLLLIIPDEDEGREPTEEEIALADARLEASIVSPGRAIGTDNECIDADLAQEYAATNAQHQHESTQK